MRRVHKCLTFPNDTRSHPRWSPLNLNLDAAIRSALTQCGGRQARRRNPTAGHAAPSHCLFAYHGAQKHARSRGLNWRRLRRHELPQA